MTKEIEPMDWETAQRRYASIPMQSVHSKDQNEEKEDEMTTIEKLIATLLDCSITEGLMADDYGFGTDKLADAEAATIVAISAIIKPWNQALEAMKGVDDLLTLINDTNKDAYRFYEMDDPLSYFLETCLAYTNKGQIQAAITAMEGTDEQD